MTISIDSNIIIALWWQADPLNSIATRMLNQAHQHGRLVVSAPVYAELMGDPNRTEIGLNEFFRATGISIDWTFEERVWREAGRANWGYIQRRRLSTGELPRRILAD